MHKSLRDPFLKGANNAGTQKEDVKTQREREQRARAYEQNVLAAFYRQYLAPVTNDLSQLERKDGWGFSHSSTFLTYDKGLKISSQLRYGSCWDSRLLGIIIENFKGPDSFDATLTSDAYLKAGKPSKTVTAKDKDSLLEAIGEWVGTVAPGRAAELAPKKTAKKKTLKKG